MSERIHIKEVNQYVFTVNGKYVVKDTNGHWIRQAGEWTDNEVEIARIHSAHLDQIQQKVVV